MAGRKPPPANETDDAKFRRLANIQLKVMDLAAKRLVKLAHTGERKPDDLTKMGAFMDAAVASVKKALQPGKPVPGSVAAAQADIL